MIVGDDACVSRYMLRAARESSLFENQDDGTTPDKIGLQLNKRTLAQSGAKTHQGDCHVNKNNHDRPQPSTRI